MASELTTVRELSEQREYFDLAKNQYDPGLITNPPRHVATELALVLGKLDGLDMEKWIVDFGAGTGRLTYPLLSAGYRVVAVDLSEESFARIDDVTRDIPSRTLSMQQTIQPGSRYAAITGADILHHVNLETQIPAFSESLEEGGRLVFSEPNGLNPFWYVFITLFLDWKVEKRIIHCHRPGISRLLKKNGFKDVRLSGLGFFPTPLLCWSRPLDRFNLWLGRLPVLRLFSYRIIVEATK